MRRLQGPCKTVLPSFRAGTEDLSPEFRIFVSDTRIPIRYATQCVDSRRGVLSGRMRLPSGADGLTETQVAQITDAVLSNTEMTAAAINVIEVRN